MRMSRPFTSAADQGELRLLVAMPQDSCWNAAGNGAIGNRPGDDGTGRDDRIAPDIRHDDRRAADPRSCADVDRYFRPFLIADRDREVVNAVGASTARHVHTGGE